MRLFIYGLSAADKIDKVWEFFVVIFAIVLLVGMFKNEKKYHINIVYICLANIILLCLITVLNGIELVISFVIVALLLKMYYKRGINKVNEYELKNILYTDKNLRKLVNEYDSNHSAEELKVIKLRAKKSNKYRMSNKCYFLTIYTVTCILFIIKLLLVLTN